MKIKELLEKLTFVKERERTFNIYINPSMQERRNLNKEIDYTAIRFIVDLKEKKIYMFSSEILHRTVARDLGIPYSEEQFTKTSRYFFDIADLENGKVLMSSMSFGHNKELVYDKKILQKHKWLDKYLEWY